MADHTAEGRRGSKWKRRWSQKPADAEKEREEEQKKKRQDSERRAEDVRIQNVLRGSLGNIPPLASKVVRVFISSTFTDMVCERNALMEHTYPRLKNLCKQHGLEFQVVDMRWGVPEEVQDDHMTSSLCMKEIHSCQRLSVGPTFLVLMGQKYGYRPFPASIAAEEYVALQEALVADGKDVSLLEKWYKKDENVLPSVYSLAAISSLIPDYTNKEEPGLQEAARNQWWGIFQELQTTLRHAATLCHQRGTLSAEDQEKYFISVTEDEIRHGILLDKVENRQACLTRNIIDLSDHMTERAALKFLDLLPGCATADQEARRMLGVLQNTKIPQKLSAENQKTFQIEWKGDSGVSADSHQEYLTQLCEASYQVLANQITAALTQRDTVYNDELVVEILQHLSLCKARCETFCGQEHVLSQIRQYFTVKGSHDPCQPMVVHGESGSGKTSIMAQVVKLVPDWLQQKGQPVIVCRFLGTTPKSSGIFNLLLTVCGQIGQVYTGQRLQVIPESMQELVNHFTEVLQLATADKPLVLIFDALDQLSATQHAHSLMWLPWQLPEHVYMVVSCLPKEHGLLERLNSIVVSENNYVLVPAMAQSLSYEMVQTWLKHNNRTLTSEQFRVVKGALSKCTLPLYTKLVYEEVSRWRSYSQPDKMVLAATVQGIIKTLLDRVETNHGKVLVSHALSYISASRNGLSEMEVEDVLSLDDTVLDDVFAFWVPPIRRIPPLLWTRVKDELSSYLVEREAAGVIVIAWYHRQFWDVTKERYMKDCKFLKRIHSNLADYYIGVWGGGIKKPFKYTHRIMKRLGIKSADSHADRKLPQQPLEWKTETQQDMHYNLRKMHELPYHLLRSERYKDLITLVLMNYKWLHCKLRAMSLAEVLTDFNMAGETLSDTRLGTIAAVLRIGGMPLAKSPNGLAAEIVGRLKSTKSSAKTEMTEFVEQCETEAVEHCALLPAFPCFMSPFKSLLFSLEGHKGQVTDMLFNKDSSCLYSVSADGCVSAWDVSTGERSHMAYIHKVKDTKHIELLQAGDNQVICETYTEKSPLFVLCNQTLKTEHAIGKRKPGFLHDTLVTAKTVIREGELLDIHSGRVVKSLKLLSEANKYLTVASTSDDKYCFVGGDKGTLMIDTETEEEVLRLPGPSVPSQLLLTSDNNTLIAGYTIDCSVAAFNVHLHSDKVGKELLQFSYQQCFPNVVFRKGEPYCQEVCEMSLSQAADKILTNVKYCHLFVIPLNNRHPTNLDVSFNEDNHHINNSAFTHDDRLVVATAGAKLCAWCPNSGELAWSINLHGPESEDHLLLPAPSAGLLATVSRFDPIIRIWDIDKLQNETEHKSHFFTNPLDKVVVDQTRKLAFIKTYRRLDSHHGYHYIDHFGVDLWNLSTNTHRCLLPRAKFGQLKRLVMVGQDQSLCLWIEGTHTDHIYFVDTDTGLISSQVDQKGCKEITLSADGQYLLTEAHHSMPFHNTAKLWLVSTGSLLHVVEKVRSPVISLDSQYLIYLYKHSLRVYSISSGQEDKFSVSPGITKLQTVPGKRDVVLGTLVNNLLTKHSIVFVYNYQSKTKLFKITNVSIDGFKDISKNGCCAVDGTLQVFDLNTGHRVASCDPDSQGQGVRSLVRLTHPGCHVVWADTQPTDCLRVYKVSSQRLVATVSTHSKVVSLNLADYGFTVLAGCQDGNLLTFKLHQTETTDSSQSKQPQTESDLGQVSIHVSQSEESPESSMGPCETVVHNSKRSTNQRANGDAQNMLSVPKQDNVDGWSLKGGSRMLIAPEVVASLDLLFQAGSVSQEDSSLPGEWSAETRQHMERNAHMVHTVNLRDRDQHGSCTCVIF